MVTTHDHLDIALARIDQLRREIDLLREQLEIKETQNWSLRQELAALKAVMGRMQVDREFSI